MPPRSPYRLSLLLALLLLMTFAVPADHTAGATSAYRSPWYGFALSVPPGWSILRAGCVPALLAAPPDHRASLEVRVAKRRASVAQIKGTLTATLSALGSLQEDTTTGTLTAHGIVFQTLRGTVQAGTRLVSARLASAETAGNLYTFVGMVTLGDGAASKRYADAIGFALGSLTLPKRTVPAAPACPASTKGRAQDIGTPIPTVAASNTPTYVPTATYPPTIAPPPTFTATATDIPFPTVAIVAVPTTTPPAAAPVRVSVGQATSYTDSNGFVQVVGYVLNNGESAVQNVQVAVSLLDANGGTVGATTSTTAREVLPVGQRSPFRATFSAAPVGWVSARVQAQADPFNPTSFYYSRIVTSLPTEGVTLTRPASDGDPTTVAGQIRNTSQSTLRFVQVIVILYDAGGNTVGVDSTYAALDTIGPGQTAPFSLNLYPSAAPSGYEVYVEGRAS